MLCAKAVGTPKPGTFALVFRAMPKSYAKGTSYLMRYVMLDLCRARTCVMLRVHLHYSLLSLSASMIIPYATPHTMP